ncbi:MAG: alpha/beta hydrolase [Ignavibacteriales bacterium]|nr:alpha/beta hydrolase [Ignavibacteriales bacterium]
MKRKILFLLIVFICWGATTGQAQQVIRLWPDVAGAVDKDTPTLTVYLPDADKATGAAIIICPGGAYRGLAKHEGEGYAQFLTPYGITAFVLKYRLGSDGYKYKEIVADVARAMRLVRANAQRWYLKPNALGIMGSSAGGHLASTLMTHFDAGDSTSNDYVERASSRPDFGILCYPVISMGDVTHKVSREQFLGIAPSPKLIALYSNELQVTSSTPPCFLFHTYEDQAVSVENSLNFAKALQKNGVPFDLHIYEHGRHGLGVGDTAPFTNAHPWTRDLIVWLKGRAAIN